MKKIIFTALYLTTLLSSAHAAEFKYGGYMRAPVGTNSSGGKQILLSNPGSRGNEFRLGNEGGYGEAFLSAHFAESKEPNASYFDANLTFAYDPSMNSQYNDTTATNGDRIFFVEAYAKGGNFDGLLASFWAGKRFYRDGDVHMNDFFYFADMSGNGGGLEDLELANGKFSVALLQYADDRSLQNATTGNPAKQALDLRWRDFKISENGKLEFWLAGAYTGPGKGVTTVGATPVDYQASNGAAAGVKWTQKLVTGTNDFAVLYGSGVMESMTLNTTAFAADDSVKKRNRVRVVENYSADFNDKWSAQAAAAFEMADSGLATNNKSSWTSLGVRPMYHFTDHFRLQTELGYSIVKNEAETNAAGSKVGDRHLARITIAPEVAFAKGYYTRPVVRFYATHTFWNDANKDVTNADSLLGQLNSKGTVSLNDKSNETQLGFQAEAWF